MLTVNLIPDWCHCSLDEKHVAFSLWKFTSANSTCQGIQTPQSNLIPQNGNWQSSRERGNRTVSPVIRDIDFRGQEGVSPDTPPQSERESCGAALLRVPTSPDPLPGGLEVPGFCLHFWNETFNPRRITEKYHPQNHTTVGEVTLQGHPGPE